MSTCKTTGNEHRVIEDVYSTEAIPFSVLENSKCGDCGEPLPLAAEITHHVVNPVRPVNTDGTPNVVAKEIIRGGVYVASGEPIATREADDIKLPISTKRSPPPDAERPTTSNSPTAMRTTSDLLGATVVYRLLGNRATIFAGKVVAILPDGAPEYIVPHQAPPFDRTEIRQRADLVQILAALPKGDPDPASMIVSYADQGRDAFIAKPAFVPKKFMAVDRRSYTIDGSTILDVSLSGDVITMELEHELGVKLRLTARGVIEDGISALSKAQTGRILSDFSIVHDPTKGGLRVMTDPGWGKAGVVFGGTWSLDSLS